MAVTWLFAGITLLSVAAATFFRDIRRAVLSLWMAGLGAGGLYLSLGAEFLAVTQWIVSTLSVLAFVYFAVMFGEFARGPKEKGRRRLVPIVLSILLGGAFTVMVWRGSAGLIAPAGEAAAAAAGAPTDLRAVGEAMVGQHLISLEVLALTLFLILVGGGVVARPERGKSGGGGEDDTRS